MKRLLWIKEVFDDVAAETDAPIRVMERQNATGPLVGGIL